MALLVLLLALTLTLGIVIITGALALRLPAQERKQMSPIPNISGLPGKTRLLAAAKYLTADQRLTNRSQGLRWSKCWIAWDCVSLAQSRERPD